MDVHLFYDESEKNFSVSKYVKNGTICKVRLRIVQTSKASRLTTGDVWELTRPNPWTSQDVTIWGERDETVRDIPLRALIGPMGIITQDSRFKKNFLNSGKIMEEDSGLSGEAYNCSSPSSTSGLFLLYGTSPPCYAIGSNVSDPPCPQYGSGSREANRSFFKLQFLYFLFAFTQFVSFVSKMRIGINFKLVKGSKAVSIFKSGTERIFERPCSR